MFKINTNVIKYSFVYQILLMEESEKLFQKFLERIAQTQQQLDVFRTKIKQISQARQEIFNSIKPGKKSMISITDFQEYCQNHQITFSSAKILEKYFNFTQDILTFNQFCQALLPHNECNVKVSQNQNPHKLFIKYIQGIIYSFKQIENARMKLLEKKALVEKYFCRNYNALQSLNKSIIREFMHQHNLYDFSKFFNVCFYLFGEKSQEISFQELFSPEKEVLSKRQTQSRRQTQSKRQIQSKRQASSRRQIKVLKNENRLDINQVLEQIDNIEKTLREKKQRKVQFASTQFEERYQTQTRSKPQRQGAGKIVSRKSSTHNRRQVKRQVEEKNQQRRQRSFNRYEHGLSKEISQKIFKKSASEAQLKIQEIQRRVMAKYVNRNPYYDNDCFDHPSQGRGFFVEPQLQKSDWSFYSSQVSRSGLRMRQKIPKTRFPMTGSDGSFLPRNPRY